MCDSAVSNRQCTCTRVVGVAAAAVLSRCGQQLLYCVAHTGLTSSACPAGPFNTIGSKKNHRRLANDSEITPDFFVQAPLKVGREQLFRGHRGRSDIRPTGDRDEVDLALEVRSYLVNDGQLPSTDASPLGPEDHERGIRRLAQRVGRPIGERKGEVSLALDRATGWIRGGP